MASWPARSLKIRLLIVLMLAGGLPLLLFIGFNFYAIDDLVTGRISDQMKSSLTLVGSMLDDQFQALENMGKMITEDEVFRMVLILGLSSKFEEYMSGLKDKGDLSFASITDAQGRTLDHEALFLTFKQGIKHPFIDRAKLGITTIGYFTFKTGDLKLLDPRLRYSSLVPASDQKILVQMLATPLRGDRGELNGIFIVGKILNMERDLVQKMKRITGIDLAIVMGGRIVAGSILEPFGPVSYLSDFPDNPRDQIIDIGELRYHVHNLALNNFQGKTVAVVKILISDESFKRLRQTLYLSGLVVLGVGGALAIMVSFVFTGKIVRRIQVLGHFTYRIAEGRLDEEIPVDRNDEIGGLIRDFNTMVRGLAERTKDLEAAQAELVQREKLAVLGRLTATVSHELRNPLGTVRNSIFTIKEGLKEKDLKLVERALARAERGITRCDGIIEELLDYTRTSTLKLEETPMDQWLADLLEETVLPEDIGLSSRLESGVSLKIDRERLRRCLINIIDNAWQALMDELDGQGKSKPLDSKPLVMVEARTQGDRLLISVSDNGPGIPESQMEKIFEPLYSTKTFGVGFGLMIVKQIMDQHHGSMEISSQPGRGTQVLLWLPLSRLDQSVD